MIITDIDAVDNDGEKINTSDGVTTCNRGLEKFFDNRDIEYLLSVPPDSKVKNDIIRIAYQIEENDYFARSFEDAFMARNRPFLEANLTNVISRSNRVQAALNDNDWYKLASYLNKKTEFAVSILFYSEENYSNWEIPLYIKEGLEWLAN